MLFELALSLLSAPAAASYIGIPTNLNDLRDRAVPVTPQDISNFQYYVQYDAASFCDSVEGQPSGTLVTCSPDGCPDLTANGADIVTTFEGTLTAIAGYVATDPVRRVIAVAVRGSSNVPNWIADGVFPQIPCNLTAGCLVHTGFFEAWSEISTAVLSGIEQAITENPGYSLVVTGHSLGAAVATLAAGYLRQAGYALDLYTFGSPRVGNDVFVNFIDAQDGAEYRVTHFDDPVPRVPPIITGYSHTSPEYWLSDGSATTTSYGVADIIVCEGTTNITCNGGTTGLDATAHLYYFEKVDACNSDFLGI